MLAIACAFAAACSGSIPAQDGDVPPEGGSSNPAGNAGRAGTGGAGGNGIVPPDPARAVRLPARRLNVAELTATVQAAFGVAPRAGVIPADALSGRFDRDAEHFDVDATIAAAYLDLAVETARAIAPAKVAGCTPVTRACVKTFLDGKLSVLLRRPTTPADVDAYLATFDRGAQRAGADEGFRELVARVVASPDFLYLLEVAVGKGDEAPLAPHALATRLAFAVWRAPPDAALFAKAVAGASTADLAAAVMGDARAAAGLRAFHSQWLDVASARKADGRTGAPSGLGAALERSMHKWIDRSYAMDLPLTGLLAGDGIYVEAPIAQLLQVTAAAEPVSRRAGILLHPGFLAAQAHATETSPILRGAFVGQRIACAPLAQPDLDLTSFPVDPKLPTTRARAEQQTSPAACAGCHEIINPLGFAFEGYDQLGRQRTMDGAAPVDTKGTFVRLGVDGSFANAEEMLDRLLGSPVARACFARTWLEWLLARPLTDGAYDARITMDAARTDGGVSAVLRALLASKPVTTLKAD